MFLGPDIAVFARRIPHEEDQAPQFLAKNSGEQIPGRADWFRISPDGVVQNLTSEVPDVSAVPIHAGKGSITVFGSDGVYRIYEDGSHRRLTRSLEGEIRLTSHDTILNRGGVVRPDFAEEALFEITDRNGVRAMLVDLREGGEGKVIEGGAPSENARAVAGRLDAEAILMRTDGGRMSKLVVAVGRHRSDVRTVAQINNHLSDIDEGTWRVVGYKVRHPDGRSKLREIESCILLPSGFDARRPPPLLVEVYPNARANCVGSKPSIASIDADSPYIWAGKGYAYARITVPRDLTRTKEGPIAGMDELIEAGVNAFVAEGLVDPERMALYGFSQGGVSALYVAAHSHRFNAVIARNSWADLFSHYFGGAGISALAYDRFGAFVRYDSDKGGDFGIGATPFEAPELYFKNSPVFLAPNIEMPVLLMHSDMDLFPMSQFDEMYGALLRAGKDARYVRYWGEGHGPSSPANIRDMWRRFDDFLTEHGVAPDHSPATH
jgi:hypothetical protein